MSRTPLAVTVPPGLQLVRVAAGGAHSVFLGSDGAVYASGSNAHGQAGFGASVKSVSRPVVRP